MMQTQVPTLLAHNTPSLGAPACAKTLTLVHLLSQPLAEPLHVTIFDKDRAHCVIQAALHDHVACHVGRLTQVISGTTADLHEGREARAAMSGPKYTEDDQALRMNVALA